MLRSLTLLGILLATTDVSHAQDDTAKAAGDQLAVKYHDGTPDGKRSIAGTGEMIQFSLPSDTQKLRGLRLHCARYGLPQPPKEDAKISVVGEDEKNVLHTELVPYSKFERGESKWTAIIFKSPVKVEKTFWVILEFNAAQTKGVYISFDTSTGGKYSRIGSPGGESKPVTTGGDWMIEALLTKPD
jgi:hypothetical protein